MCPRLSPGREPIILVRLKGCLTFIPQVKTAFADTPVSLLSAMDFSPFVGGFSSNPAREWPSVVENKTYRMILTRVQFCLSFSKWRCCAKSL